MKPTMITKAIEKIDPAKMKIIRTEKRVPIAALAQACNVDTNTAFEWETSSRHRIPKRYWKQICNRLGCDIMELGKPPLKMQIEELKRDLGAAKHSDLQKKMTIERLQTQIKAKDDEIAIAKHKARDLAFAPPWTTGGGERATITNNVERSVRICQDGNGNYHIIVNNDGGEFNDHNNQSVVLTRGELSRLHAACSCGGHNA